MAGVATSNVCAETASTGRAVATASTRAPAIPVCTTVSVVGGNAAVQPPAGDAADGVENGNAAVEDGDLTDVSVSADTEVTIVRSAPGRVHPIHALAAVSARRLSAEEDTHVSHVLDILMFTSLYYYKQRKLFRRDYKPLFSNEPNLK